MPVEILGLADVPEAGDELAALDEKLAKTIAENVLKNSVMNLCVLRKFL